MSTLILTEQNTQPQTPSVGKVKIYATNTNPPEIYLVDDAGNSYPLVSSFENILTFNAPLVRTVDTISISQASGGTDGYLSSTDWSTFNSKENVLTFNNGLTRTSNTVSIDYTRTSNVYTGNGLVSSPLFNFNGSLYTGGTSITTKPFMLFEPTGTTSTNWSTAGTWLGINTAIGFLGKYLDFKLNNSDTFSIDYTGKVLAAADAYINGIRIGRGNNNASASTAIGEDSLNSNISGDATAIGYKSLYSNTTGYYNTGIGVQSLYFNTMGYGNVAVGRLALYNNSTGFYNTAIGVQALTSNSTSEYNVAVGYRALGDTTAGYNTGVGTETLRYNTTGTYNTGIGWRALYSNTQGEGNNGFGIWALRDNTTGSYNSGLGYTTLSQNTTGTGNSAIGRNALSKNLDGNYNTGIGYQAGGINTGGTISGTNYNVFIGAYTAENIGIGASNNIVIGYDIDLPTSTGTYQLVIGNLIYGTNISGSGTTVSSGGIGIGIAAVDASARLQIDSTSKGLLIPRWTTAQRTAISSPATSLLGYDTDLNSFYYYNGGWNTLGGGVYTASNGVTLVATDFQIDYTRTGNIYTGNGLVNSPLMWYNGSIYTGGTSTTTKPLILIEPSGTTSTSWSTDGTMFGVNAPSGFVGNIIEAKLNNSSNRYFVVNSGGVTLGISGGVNTSFGRLDIYGGNILGQDSHTTLSNSTWGVTTSLNIGSSASPISKLTIPIAPTASANYGLASFGSGPWDGVTVGFYNGSVNGTLIAGNLASGSTSDLLNLQVAGVSKFKLTSTGTITTGLIVETGTIIFGSTTASTAANFTAWGTSTKGPFDAIIAFGKTDTSQRRGFVIRTNDASAWQEINLSYTGNATLASRTFYLDTSENGVAVGGNLVFQSSGGKIGVGTGTNVPSTTVHVISTTAQLRIGYNTSNYYSTTVNSTGGVTFDAVGAGAGFTFSDKIVLADAINIEFNSTTGTKIGSAATEKLSFWGVTPIVQITTGVTAATFVANTSGIANDTATFDGYTIGQIVKALRNIGILA